MRQVRHALILAAVATTSVTLVAADSPGKPKDWPNFRGPNHDGIVAGAKIRTDWNGAPKVLWEYPVGSGFSAFACVDGKVYTCGTVEGEQVLFCFDANKGNVIWSRPFGKEYKDRQGGDGPRMTPTVDDGRVYVFGAHGHLICVSAKDGKPVWDRQFGAVPRWGYSGSVLIEGDLAIVSPGKDDGGLAAFNKKTGKPEWKCESDPAGYATPYPFTFNKKRYVVGFVARAALIAEMKTGKLVCRIPWKTDYDVNSSAPVYHDGHLYLGTGYNTGCALYKLEADGERLKATEIWRNKALMTKFHSVLLHDGILYSGDQEGLKCVEFLTGKERWTEKRMRHASTLIVGDQLIVLTENGKLMVAPVSPEAFEPTAEAAVMTGRCWTVPTLYDGKLYLRNLKQAVCLDVSPAS